MRRRDGRRVRSDNWGTGAARGPRACCSRGKARRADHCGLEDVLVPGQVLHGGDPFGEPGLHRLQLYVKVALQHTLVQEQDGAEGVVPGGKGTLAWTAR